MVSREFGAPALNSTSTNPIFHIPAGVSMRNRKRRQIFRVWMGTPYPPARENNGLRAPSALRWFRHERGDRLVVREKHTPREVCQKITALQPVHDRTFDLAQV